MSACDRSGIFPFYNSNMQSLIYLIKKYLFNMFKKCEFQLALKIKLLVAKERTLSYLYSNPINQKKKQKKQKKNKQIGVMS